MYKHNYMGMKNMKRFVKYKTTPWYSAHMVIEEYFEVDSSFKDIYT